MLEKQTKPQCAVAGRLYLHVLLFVCSAEQRAVDKMS